MFEIFFKNFHVLPQLFLTSSETEHFDHISTKLLSQKVEIKYNTKTLVSCLLLTQITDKNFC